MALALLLSVFLVRAVCVLSGVGEPRLSDSADNAMGSSRRDLVVAPLLCDCDVLLVQHARYFPSGRAPRPMLMFPSDGGLSTSLHFHGYAQWVDDACEDVDKAETHMLSATFGMPRHFMYAAQGNNGSCCERCGADVAIRSGLRVPTHRYTTQY